LTEWNFTFADLIFIAMTLLILFIDLPLIDWLLIFWDEQVKVCINRRIMLKIFKEPFPLEKSLKRVNQRLILLSVLVYFILVVFKPFGLKDHSGSDLFIYAGDLLFWVISIYCFTFL